MPQDKSHWHKRLFGPFYDDKHWTHMCPWGHFVSSDLPAGNHQWALSVEPLVTQAEVPTDEPDVKEVILPE